jgi:hypothetical protein
VQSAPAPPEGIFARSVLAPLGGAVGVGVGVGIASTVVYADTKGWEIVISVIAWTGVIGATLVIGATHPGA